MSRSEYYQRYNRLADIIQRPRLFWRNAGNTQSILSQLTALENEIYNNTRAPRRENINIVAQYYNSPEFNRMRVLEQRLGLNSNLSALDEAQINKRIPRLEKKLRQLLNTDLYEVENNKTYTEFIQDLQERNLSRKAYNEYNRDIRNQQIIIYPFPIKMRDFVNKTTTILQNSPHIRFTGQMTDARAKRLLEIYVADLAKEISDEYDMQSRSLIFSATHMEPSRHMGLVDTLGFDYRIEAIPRNINFSEIPLYDFRAGWYYSLGKHTEEKYIFDKQCCIDIIMEHLAGRDRFKKLMRKDIDLISNDINGVCQWLRLNKVGFNIRDALYNKIMHEPSENSSIPILHAMVNNDHIYLIKDEEQQKNFRAGKYNDFRINWDSTHMLYKCSEGSLDFTYNELVKFQSIEKTDLGIFIVKDLRTINNKENYTDLTKLIEYIYIKERLLCVNISGSLKKTVQFTYKDVVVLYNSEYNDVQDIIKCINKSNPVNEITYCNQSLAQIGMELFRNVSYAPKSCFNLTVRNAFLEPAIWKGNFYNKNDNIKDYKTFDINKCYTYSLLNRDEDQYIFDYTDTPIKYSGDDILPGYYIVYKKDGIRLDDSYKFNFGNRFTFRSQKIVKLLEMGVITKKDIIYYIKPSRSYNNNKFKDFANYIYSLDINIKIKKTIINSFIGLLGKWKSSNSNLVLSNSVLTAFSMFDDKKINDIRFSDTSNLIFLGKNERTLLHESYRNIYHDITVDSCFYLFEMYQTVKTSNSQILSYNTDSITLTFPRDNIKLSNEMGGYKLEEKILLHQSNFYEERLTNEDFYNTNEEHINTDKFEVGNSYLIIGKAGRSKTYTLCNTIIPELNNTNRKWIALGFSHQVCKNMNSYANAENKCVTLASFFNDIFAGRETDFWRKCAANINSNTYILVDEIYAVSKQDFGLLYKLFLMTKCKFIFCGDNNQLAGIDIAPIDYDKTCIMAEMCKYKIVLTEKFRFDEELDNFANKIIDGLGVDFTQEISILPKVNLCFTHNTRKRVNLECMKFYRGDNYLTIPENKSVATSQEVYISVGCIIVSTKNEGDIHNRDRFTVLSWDDETIKCVDENSKEHSILIEDFHYKFLMGYCNTIHSSQCMTITENIGLFELERYSRRMVYTAVTRVKNLRQIFVPKIYNNMIFKLEDLDFKTVQMKAEETGFIYELYDGDIIYYVGICKDIEEMRIRMNSSSKNLLGRTIKKLGYAINVRVIKEVPVYSIIRIEKIQMRYINEGHPIIIDEKLRRLENASKLDVKLVEDKKLILLGSVIEHNNNKGKLMGYKFKLNENYTYFSIKGYGNLKEAKAAADAYQNKISLERNL